MVTDKLTLILLSRLADAQLALATSMKGVTPSSLVIQRIYFEAFLKLWMQLKLL
ncbi:hypothetical protein [Pseudomonas donghuensis]|uniref:hypothetical protein n=1 Tax=Pseudomonas donghuensis TaxID=1163398 RepID=UPI00215FE997|nr:hypothetical protein [Pseudomonas donghuensis]UVL26783.1 hypothetical protein LOY30_12645 [Pseudomonas donghuensis]